MPELCMHDSIETFLKRNPSAVRVLDSLGIDSCCGGARTLEEACLARGLEPGRVLALLDGLESAIREAALDAASGIAELADRIEREHHDRLREELPRLEGLAAKVARVHGASDPRLVELHERFRAFAEELAVHMEKEERILFPALRELEACGRAEGFHCGSLASPIRVMQDEHAGADEALKALRDLTDGYSPPEWACGSYRALLAGLGDLDADMAAHIRKEEDLLFPRALALEARGGA